MKRYPYGVGYYRDFNDARNNRYAVQDEITAVWYFPKRYGIKAANDLCIKMNIENSRSLEND